MTESPIPCFAEAPHQDPGYVPGESPSCPVAKERAPDQHLESCAPLPSMPTKFGCSWLSQGRAMPLNIRSECQKTLLVNFFVLKK